MATGFDPVSTGVSAGISALGGGLLGGGSGPDPDPREFNMSNDLFNILFNKSKGLDQITSEATGALGDFQQQQLGGAGLFGDMAQNNPNAALAGALGGQFLGALGSTNPMEVAMSQFNLLNPILQKQQQQDRLSQEQRLFSQGQLGGTSGANRQGALFDSQEDARSKLLFNSLDQGLQAQQQQANIGQMLTQLDPSLRGLFQNLSTSNLQNVLGIDQAGLNRLLAGRQVDQTGGATAGPTAGQAIGAGLLNSGIEGLTGQLDNAFAPVRPASSFTTGEMTRFSGGFNPLTGDPIN